VTEIIATEAAELSLGNIAQLTVESTTNSLPVEYIVIAASVECETFADRILGMLVDASPVNQSQFGQALVSENRSEFFRNWWARLKWLSKGFGVQIDAPEIQRQRTLASLRNSIAHGSGKMSTRDIGSLDKQLGLERKFERELDVSVERGHIAFGDRSGEYALKITREFVLYVDRSVRSLHPCLATREFTVPAVT
jgi:hypothetical protein